MKGIKRLPGIYKINNIVNNIFYIGSSIKISKRLDKHINDLLTNTHQNPHLQNAWNLYGKENFTFEVIEYVPKLPEESLKEFKQKLVNGREQYYLDTLLFAQEYIRKEDKRFKKLGYNIRPIADSNLGIKQSKKTIANRVLKNTGKKRLESYKIKMSSIGKQLCIEDKNRIKRMVEAREKEILYYSLDGTFMEEFKSLTEAQKRLKISIHNFIKVYTKGIQITRKGQFLPKLNNNYPKKIKSTIRTIEVVYTNKILEFKTLEEVCKEVNKNPKSCTERLGGRSIGKNDNFILRYKYPI